MSTDRQGRSGLGLEAQREAVEDYLDGGDGSSSPSSSRSRAASEGRPPEAPGGAEHCKLTGATLVIAKLDRLARNVALPLEPDGERGRRSSPSTSRGEPADGHILARCRRAGGRAISPAPRRRSRLRRRGGQIGGYREPGALKNGRRSQGTPKLGRSFGGGSPARRATSRKRAQELAPTIDELRSQGITGLRRLARALEERGVPTASSKEGRGRRCRSRACSSSWRRGDDDRRSTGALS